MGKHDLILVGTVHGDPGGYARAWKLLSHWQPHRISVEISRFAVRFRRRRSRRWQCLLGQLLASQRPGAGQHLAIQRLAAQIKWPFEYLAARDWSRQRGLTWKAVDVSGPSRWHLPRYERELLTDRNLRALLDTADGSLEEFCCAEYRRAKQAQPDWPWRFSPWQQADTLKRERLMAGRLRRLAGHGRRIIHFGGWEHLGPRPDGSGLAGLLADLEPFCQLLDEVDQWLAEKSWSAMNLFTPQLLMGHWPTRKA